MNFTNLRSIEQFCSLQVVSYFYDNIWENLIMKKCSKRLVLIKGRCRPQWPRVLRRRSAAARLLRLWFRVPPGAWMFVYCECCVLSGRRLCDALITRPEESYRLCCVVVCDLETSRMRSPWAALGRSATGGNKMPRTAYVSYVVYLIQTKLQLTWEKHRFILLDLSVGGTDEQLYYEDFLISFP